MIKTVFWDWNGTLLDDVLYCIEVRNRSFPRFGFPAIHSVELYREQFDFPIRDYYRNAGVTDPLFDAVAHAWMDEYRQGFDRVPLHSDALETLERFQKSGIRQIMLTASSRTDVTEQVAKLGVKPYLSDILGLSDIYAVSKEAIGTAFIKESGIDPKTAVMIGDTLHDAQVAHAMGIPCVLVARGHHSKEKLLTADVPVMDSLKEVADRLIGMN